MKRAVLVQAAAAGPRDERWSSHGWAQGWEGGQTELQTALDGDATCNGAQRTADTNAKPGVTIGSGQSDHGSPNPTGSGFALWLQELPDEKPAISQGFHMHEDENPKPEPVPSCSGNVRCWRQRHGWQREDNKLGHGQLESWVCYHRVNMRKPWCENMCGFSQLL